MKKRYIGRSTLFILSVSSIVSLSVCANVPQTGVELPTRSHQWGAVQDGISNTVVQIFSQVAEFNWLQPYATPDQYGTRGSGFLINEQGAIITNAHVVDQAVALWVQMPAMGKRPLKAHIAGFCPDLDIALLQLDPDDLVLVQETLGAVPYLPICDSNSVRRLDEVLALGYPLGQESLKITTGIISGKEKYFFQISAAINPGNSGGPLLNAQGEVVGINTAGVTEAQNVGYAIPANYLRIILPAFEKNPILRKPFWGFVSVKTTNAMTDYLGNPHPGGCYLIEAIKGGLLEKAGLQASDMLYEIDGYRLDIYGQMRLPWSEDKVSITDYLGQLQLNSMVNLVVYREGERLTFSFPLEHTKLPPVHMVYPWYETIEYEVFAGMVVMPLTNNHVNMLADKVPGLASFADTTSADDPVLLITHIFANSALGQSRTMMPGCTISEINGKKVTTIKEFREALTISLKTGFFVLKAVDQIFRSTDKMGVVLPIEKLITKLPELSQLYRFPISDTVKKLCTARSGQQEKQVTQEKNKKKRKKKKKE